MAERRDLAVEQAGNAKCRAVCAAAVVATALGSFVSVGHAASGTWSGAAGDGLWETPGNWDSVPGTNDGATGTSADVAIFAGAPTSFNVAVDLNRNVAGLTFDNTSTPFIIGGATAGAGNTLYLSAGGTTQLTNTVTLGAEATLNEHVNAPIVLNGNAYTFRNDNANGAIGLRINGPVTAGAGGDTVITLDGVNSAGVNLGPSQVQGTISNGASGTVSVVKNGTGTWELDAALATPNTYSGDTTVNGGVLRFNGLGGASLNSNLVINSGGKIRFSQNGAVAKSVELRSGGLLDASNSTVITNLKNETGPALHLNFSSTVVAPTIGLNFTGTTPEQGGVKLSNNSSVGQADLGGTGTPYNIGTVMRPFDISRGAAANAYDLRVRGPISGGGPAGGIVKIGNGILRIDNPVNSFTGTVEVREGELRINNSNALTGVPALLITGGNLHVNGGHTQTFSSVTVTKGSSTRSNTLSTIASPTYALNIATGDTASIDPVLADSGGASTLTKTGGGSATLTGTLSYTGPTVVQAGVLSLGTNLTTSSSITVSGGTLESRFQTVPQRVIKAPSITISGGGKIDLKNNKLITDVAPGSATGGVYSGVQGMVQAGLNGGAWNGSGIVTSEGDALNNLTTIGVATGSEVFGIGATDTALFAGQTVTGSQTLAMYTYAGDLNLSGAIDPDDYANISFADNDPNAQGYYNGDINYDGDINADDFAAIDFNFNSQGAPFPVAGSIESLGGVTAVPEPSTFGFVVLSVTAGSLCRKRRQRRATSRHV